jgi:hypothetical protein
MVDTVPFTSAVTSFLTPEPDFVLDFKNAVYEAAGSPVALNTMLVQDLVNFGSFNAASDISAGEGLASGNPAFTGALQAAMAAGATVRVTVNAVIDGSNTTQFNIDAADLPDQNTYVSAVFTASASTTTRYVDDGSTDATVVTGPRAGISRFVFQLLPTSSASCLNGSAPAAVSSSEWSPVPTGGDIAKTQEGFLEKIEVWATALTNEQMIYLSSIPTGTASFTDAGTNQGNVPLLNGDGHLAVPLDATLFATLAATWLQTLPGTNPTSAGAPYLDSADGYTLKVSQG